MSNPIENWLESDRRKLKSVAQTARKVESFAPQMEKLSDQQLQAKTPKFKQRLANGETLDDLLPEAFAVAREGAFRVLGMKPFHVQIMGGIILHGGNIAEMQTGEGKTLTATMPVYLNALSGKGVHVITVNEYLSGRDAKEMGVLYNWLGCSVGVNNSQKNAREKKAAYAADIMYSTHSEIGFDYLRDNMADYPEDQVQRPFNFALVDEVDSVLVDEAKTPLIVSGAGTVPASECQSADRFVKLLKEKIDYKVDLKQKTVVLLEPGMHKAEKFFNVNNIYSADNISLTHHIAKALNANYMMKRDKDYMVKDNEILIIDSFTGRTMSGRRFSDGLHQALEAKEHVKIQKENKTMASITYQNLFQMYDVLSGMTGTAKSEKEEFRETYHMDVLSVPTNRPKLRLDQPDIIFPTINAKFNAVANEIQKRHAKGQPLLIGTVAVQSSEKLSKLLDDRHIKHTVLNAKNNATEAQIIKQAGAKGAVTIATNMASRGTDIKLTQEVRDLGGLAVIGTERHDSRRIDDQLRGRSGRQGDPGFSQFYVSLEDDLMKKTGGQAIKHYLAHLKPEQENVAVTSKMLSKQVENAQLQVEGNNYDSRKNTLKYDNILREQRQVIYTQRQQVIDEQHSLNNIFLAMALRTIHRVVTQKTAAPHAKDWDLKSVLNFANEDLNANLKLRQLQHLNQHQLEQLLAHKLKQQILKRQTELNYSSARLLELQRVLLLQTVDNHWADYIDAMTDFQTSVQMRSYAQINPLVSFQTESYQMFEDMIAQIEYEVTKNFCTAEITAKKQIPQM